MRIALDSFILASAALDLGEVAKANVRGPEDWEVYMLHFEVFYAAPACVCLLSVCSVCVFVLFWLCCFCTFCCVKRNINNADENTGLPATARAEPLRLLP